ncbi:hypothetical protein psal_cds_421 [Pandoravirus salinus]|uniref:Uncharacterized protein n=1 Tax=Pandoravirus salinus TaxID=1349410 RepID=S4VXG2_9VIRU|nr:hypothetical protein psal_cds_421 [Pandoravirus salinus]AGO84146.1 hypothetical protein psal_cds_421 [Pandoravirus salinus]
MGTRGASDVGCRATPPHQQQQRQEQEGQLVAREKEMARRPTRPGTIRNEKGDADNRADASGRTRRRCDCPESLAVLCCRAVERDGCGPRAASALGELHRWIEVRIEALGPLARIWPRLARPAAWDLAWYRPACADLLDQVRAIDRADAHIFPARNRGTMRDWIYAHADGRAAARLPDAHPYTETLLRRDVDAQRYSLAGQRGRSGWLVPHACSLSLPTRLALPDDVACLVHRPGGPRQDPESSLAGTCFVDHPYPLMTHHHHQREQGQRQSILLDVVSWPPARGLPAAPAYPFDHVVVARWRRGSARGLVCVNANPDAAADYGLVCSIYMGAETAYIPHGAPLGDLMRAFEAARPSSSGRLPYGPRDGAMQVDRSGGDHTHVAVDGRAADDRQRAADQTHCRDVVADSGACAIAVDEWSNRIVAEDSNNNEDDDFFLWLMRRRGGPHAPTSGSVASDDA